MSKFDLNDWMKRQSDWLKKQNALYYRWALADYILDPFSQLDGSDIDG